MNIRHLVLSFILVFMSATSSAQTLFRDGLENFSIDPQFPLIGGTFQLPPGPASAQLTWLLGELAVGQTTTVTEVNAHFDSTWLSSINATATINFINAVRTDYPNAKITDVISVTPMQITALIDSPGSPLPSGFLSFGTRFAGAGLINLFGVNPFTSTMYAIDMNLTMTQAADKFVTLSALPSLLVGRINANTGQCSAIEDRFANTARSTASIFKTWIMGGVGRAIANGTLNANELITLDGNKNVAGSVITSEPLGTQFSASQLATFMMGNSDNTATDILHARVGGRAFLHPIITEFGVANPNTLTPLLSISEQFHLFSTVTATAATNFATGIESFQNTYADNTLLPLGRFISGSNSNFNLMTDTGGSWQASAYDICRAFAALRRFPQGSDAMREVDRAMSSQAAQPLVRGNWDRVWYKGGSLATATNQYRVFTHAWLLEDAGRDPFVLIAMSNSPTSAISDTTIFEIQSVAGRMLQLLSQLP